MPHNIFEAEEKEFMTRQETKLKAMLLALLRDDSKFGGTGRHHAKYADRLQDFIVKIVMPGSDLEKQGLKTAAIDVNEGVIYIHQGFLTDPSTFLQLGVLMRHELAHALMNHELRMLHRLTADHGQDHGTHLSKSTSLQHLLNVIEDFEISNTRYTEEDKQTVRNMWLNGKLISGLITEDHRQAWASLPLEDMYTNLLNEIQRLNAEVIQRWQANGVGGVNDNFDQIRHTAAELYGYVDTKSPTSFQLPIKDFLKTAEFNDFADAYKDIIKAIVDEFDTPKYTASDIKARMDELAQTTPLDEYDLKSAEGKTIVKLYSPEEKWAAMNTLKAIKEYLELYDTWFQKVKDVLGDGKYSDDDLKRIYDEVKGDK